MNLTGYKKRLAEEALLELTGGNMYNKEKRAEKFYSSFLTYTESLFDGLRAGSELNFNSIQKMIKLTCEFVRLERDHIVCAMQTAGQYKNPQVSHSVRSSIFAVIIGTYMKLPERRLIELGTAGLLCNIGMLNLPGRIYTGNGEWRLLKSGAEYDHPIYANRILKSFNFPLSVCEAVLQHHEQEDGSGFPLRLKGGRIGLYGKILVVAGFYEAFSMEYIEEAKRCRDGIMQLLKNGGSFDASVIRALVNSVTICPVGIYILLSSGEYRS